MKSKKFHPNSDTHLLKIRDKPENNLKSKEKKSNNKPQTNHEIEEHLNEEEAELRIRTLKLKSIKRENLMLDINLLQTHFKKIKVYSNLSSNKKNKNSISPAHFNNLFELQNFHADYQELWCAKVNSNSTYLATGGKSGILKIWELIQYDLNFKLNPKEIYSSMQLINEKPYKEYIDHVDDIVDICWSYKNPNVVLTASLDQYVIMWDISKSEAIGKYHHISH